LKMGSDYPIQGVGLGNFPELEPKYTAETIDLIAVRHVLGKAVVHNTYLETFAELGLIGSILFLAIIQGAFASVIRGVRATTSAGDLRTSLLVRGLTAGAVGLLTVYFFDSAQYQKQLWLILGLLIAVPRATSARPNPAQPPRGPTRLGT
jgi:O-antigen ligase